MSYADLDGSGTIESGSEILEEKNYYPFGLLHDGYNMGVKPQRSVEAEQIKYNGKEFEDSFGLNMYEMDLRQYDPAIARWVVQDPVVHHDFSPYSAFDNNPVYWADPSGADAVPILDGDKTIGWSFSGDAIGDFYDYFNQYTNNNFEATYENFYEMVSLNEGSGGGNGNGGGKNKGANDRGIGINNWQRGLTGMTGYTFFGAPIRISPPIFGASSYSFGAINVSSTIWKEYLTFGLKSWAGRHLMHEYGHYLQEKYSGIIN